VNGQGPPALAFVGFDYHAASVEAARRAAERAGVSDRVRFEVPSAKDFARACASGARGGGHRARALRRSASPLTRWTPEPEAMTRV
jgi:hypothetical protein